MNPEIGRKERMKMIRNEKSGARTENREREKKSPGPGFPVLII